MRTLLTFVALLVLTPVLGGAVVLAAMLGFPDREGSIYDRAPRWWARGLLRAAGVKVEVANPERLRHDQPRIYVATHTSWFDVLALAAVLPRYKFVGKAELFRIPLFGRAMRAAGMIEIQRDNRKAAFESYRVAAERIRQGASVVVYPEGTRGETYVLRQFKKGPFVLAVAAGVPIVPTILHGTIEALPRGSFNVRPGTIRIHLLDEIETAGLTYEDRDQLSTRVRDRMAAALNEIYGVPHEPRVTARAS